MRAVAPRDPVVRSTMQTSRQCDGSLGSSDLRQNHHHFLLPTLAMAPSHRHSSSSDWASSGDLTRSFGETKC